MTQPVVPSAENWLSSSGPQAASKVAGRIRLLVYPGEFTTVTGVTLGHIYVLNGSGEKYEIAGGLPPDPKRGRGADGHFADATPAGRFVLSAAEHHVTQNWPASVVPWGAPLRVRPATPGKEAIIEYFTGGQWRAASGPQGRVTAALISHAARRRVILTPAQASADAFQMFADPFTQRLRAATWEYNDFGPWSWNLMKQGQRTAYYIHTTPTDEAATGRGAPFDLGNSHGCIHIRPSHRDEMMKKGYLKAGLEIEVKPYGQKGPP